MLRKPKQVKEKRSTSTANVKSQNKKSVSASQSSGNLRRFFAGCCSSGLQEPESGMSASEPASSEENEFEEDIKDQDHKTEPFEEKTGEIKTVEVNIDHGVSEVPEELKSDDCQNIEARSDTKDLAEAKTTAKMPESKCFVISRSSDENNFRVTVPNIEKREAGEFPAKTLPEDSQCVEIKPQQLGDLQDNALLAESMQISKSETEPGFQVNSPASAFTEVSQSAIKLGNESVTPIEEDHICKIEQEYTGSEDPVCSNDLSPEDPTININITPTAKNRICKNNQIKIEGNNNEVCAYNDKTTTEEDQANVLKVHISVSSVNLKQDYCEKATQSQNIGCIVGFDIPVEVEPKEMNVHCVPTLIPLANWNGNFELLNSHVRVSESNLSFLPSIGTYKESSKEYESMGTLENFKSEPEPNIKLKSEYENYGICLAGDHIFEKKPVDNPQNVEILYPVKSAFSGYLRDKLEVKNSSRSRLPKMRGKENTKKPSMVDLLGLDRLDFEPIDTGQLKLTIASALERANSCPNIPKSHVREEEAILQNKLTMQSMTDRLKALNLEMENLQKEEANLTSKRKEVAQKTHTLKKEKQALSRAKRNTTSRSDFDTTSEFDPLSTQPKIPIELLELNEQLASVQRDKFIRQKLGINTNDLDRLETGYKCLLERMGQNTSPLLHKISENTTQNLKSDINSIAIEKALVKLEREDTKLIRGLKNIETVKTSLARLMERLVSEIRMAGSYSGTKDFGQWKLPEK